MGKILLMKKLKSAGIFWDRRNELAQATKKKCEGVLRRAKIGFGDAEAVPAKKYGFIIVIGGDGTMLKAAGKFDVPLLGINCGKVGHIMEMDCSEIGLLKGVVNGKYSLEKRSRISCNVDGKKMRSALNEVLVAAKEPISLISYRLEVGKELGWADSGDGVIICTPTGSTGHGLSAGGSEISRDAKVMQVVPLNSAGLGRRPLVLDENAKIKISEIHSRKGCVVIVDGQNIGEVEKEVVAGKGKGVVIVVPERPKTALKKRRVSAAGRAILGCLSERPLIQKEIIERSGLSERTVRRVLAKLLGQGMLTRKKGEKDRRKAVFTARAVR